MPVSEHGQLTTSEGIHIAYQWSYADAAARTGASGFVAADVGKLARQLDNNTLWTLTATTPTWVKSGGPDSAIDHGSISGLGDDDHTIYLLADGTRPMTGDIDAGSNSVINASIDAALIDSGTLPDARIQASGVTQHQGSIVHGSISGLGDDDHTQYLLVDGSRAGATGAAQDFGSNGIKADTLAESTGANGIDVSHDLDLASGADVYPDGNDVGIQNRFNAQISPDDHFNGSALSANWAWDSVFGVTPDTVSVASSQLTIAFGAGQGTSRAFLVWQGSSTTFAQTLAKLTMRSPSSGDYVGVRIDDGTDDNFTETVLYYDGTNVLFYTRHQTGGGGVTSTNQGTHNSNPNFANIAVSTGGTRFTNWQSTFNKIATIETSSQTGASISTGLTWTPTRRGLIFYTNAATPAAFRKSIVEFYKAGE